MKNNIKNILNKAKDVAGNGIKVAKSATGTGINVAKNAAGTGLKAAKNVVNYGKEVMDKKQMNAKIKEKEKHIEEHKYNIGKLIYDNDIEINDNFIISNINTIDRLEQEISAIGEKENG